MDGQRCPDSNGSHSINYRSSWLDSQDEYQPARHGSVNRASRISDSHRPTSGTKRESQTEGPTTFEADQWLEGLRARAGGRPTTSRDHHTTVDEEERSVHPETTVRKPAPSQAEEPAQRDQEPRRNSSLDSDEEDVLNEVAAPASVQQENQSGSWRREDHLEDELRKSYPSHHYEEPKSAPHVSPIATQLYIISHLILWSILGTLARLGTQWITFYPGAPVAFSNLWANFGGTLIMGFLAEDRKLFREEWGSPPRPTSADHKTSDPGGHPQTRADHLKTKKTIPLYIGLTIGFCGSFTSFSAFERDVFLALANKLPYPISHPGTTSSSSTPIPRNGGYSFEALLAVIILTITACIGALQFGAHLAITLDRFTPAIPFRLTRRSLDPFIVFLGIGVWIGAVVMAAVPPDRLSGPAYAGHKETWRGQVLFSLVFAPLGCLLRFYMSLKLNGLVPSFPLGTFTANIFGTAVLGMTYDLQRAPVSAAGMGAVVGVTGCQVLQGVEDGFCGTLTTVSTWVVELTGLRRRHAYVYGGASVFMGLGILVVVMGSVLWTVGWRTPSCAVPVS